MIELPTGTVAFLFTDIEGSTDLATQYPGEMPQLLARHNAILNEAIRANHGHVFRMAGDAFCAAFETSREALGAALMAQRALQHEVWSPAAVKVRMGIHTGEAQSRESEGQMDPYGGYLTLTRVARVMAVAHGGQILLSNVTAEMVRGELPPDVTLRDMGAHDLKGLGQPETLWQVVAPDLQQEFAPLQTAGFVPSNLPIPLSRFIGREEELEEVKERLRATRLVTLLGPGGMGKTRLALEAAADLKDEFQDRVYFVDLASSREPEAVLEVFGRTIGLREQSDATLLEQLKKKINHKRMLSLMDNFEQVTEAAPTMAELLRDCPELKMLVTSREALRVRGENVFPVPPLSLPATEFEERTVKELADSEAVQMFLDRARAVKPDFELTEENASAVAEICARLDGLPLAIELATARLKVLSPQALAARLEDRLTLLRGGARDLPARHQTLRDTIEWSYEMLEPSEQNLFKLLAVFSGATLEAVEAVAGGVPQIRELDVLDGVGSLVDKSLLQQIEQANGSVRFRMLETIREYAEMRLEQDEELRDAACHAHAAYFAKLTAGQLGKLDGEGRGAALELLTEDLDNIETARRFWVGEGNYAQLGKFTDSLWLLYDARGWYRSAVQLMTDMLQVLEHSKTTPDRERQEILLQAGLARALLASKGYTAEVHDAFVRALELSERAGDVPQMFPVLRALSLFHTLRGEEEKAVVLGQRIVALGEQANDAEIKSEGLLIIGENIGFVESIPDALEYLEKSIATFDPNRPHSRHRRLGTQSGVAKLIVSAMCLWLVGLPEKALQKAAEGVALARKQDHAFSYAYALFHLAQLEHWLGQNEAAELHTRQVMEEAEEHEFPIWSAVGMCLHGAAQTQLGRFEEGLRELEEGITEYRWLKSPPVFMPLLLYFFACGLVKAGKPAEAMELLREVGASLPPDKGRVFAPEFLGLVGVLLYQAGRENAAEAEGMLVQAVELARMTKAVTTELRAATRLARVWREMGKTEQAREVLQAAYVKMTEGFELRDMVEAREVLESLG